MENKLLSEKIISRIQSYLSAMDWQQTKVHAWDGLKDFLTDVRDILGEKALTFRLDYEEKKYTKFFYVDVFQKKDSSTCCFDKIRRLRIYSDKVLTEEEIKMENKETVNISEQNIDELTEKANKLKELLQEVKILINSLGGTVNNVVVNSAEK